MLSHLSSLSSLKVLEVLEWETMLENQETRSEMSFSSLYQPFLRACMVSSLSLAWFCRAQPSLLLAGSLCLYDAQKACLGGRESVWGLRSGELSIPHRGITGVCGRGDVTQARLERGPCRNLPALDKSVYTWIQSPFLETKYLCIIKLHDNNNRKEKNRLSPLYQKTFFLFCHQHMYLYTGKRSPEEKALSYFTLTLLNSVFICKKRANFDYEEWIFSWGFSRELGRGLDRTGRSKDSNISC